MIINFFICSFVVDLDVSLIFFHWIKIITSKKLLYTNQSIDQFIKIVKKRKEMSSSQQKLKQNIEQQTKRLLSQL
jgi:hypothetical protein